MPSTAGLCVIGSVNVDQVFRISEHPKPGETVLATGFETFPGGKGANQAYAAAQRGARVSLVARIGEDDLGRRYCELLRDSGVHVSGVLATRGHDTGAAVVCVADSGENFIVVAAGANAHLTSKDVHGQLGSPTTVLVQCEIPKQTVRATLHQARRRGAFTILNASPVAGLEAMDWDWVDLLVVNVLEAGHLLAVPADDINADVEGAVRDLRRVFGCAAVLSAGSAGVVGSDASGDVFSRPAPRVGQVCDTTGAGDVLVGTLAADLTSGRSLSDACSSAVAAATASVESRGAQGRDLAGNPA